MATRSAEKAHRQSLKRRQRNRAVKSATKTAIKKANAAILSGDLNEAREATREAVVALDRAAAKGVLHPNNSARHKSRLLIKFNAAVAVQQASAPAAEAEKPKKTERAKKTPSTRASATKRTTAKKTSKK